MTPEMVLDALKGVTDPDLGVDLVTLKFVKDKDITIDGGRVVGRDRDGDAVAVEARSGCRARA